MVLWKKSNYQPRLEPMKTTMNWWHIQRDRSSSSDAHLETGICDLPVRSQIFFFLLFLSLLATFLPALLLFLCFTTKCEIRQEFRAVFGWLSKAMMCCHWFVKHFDEKMAVTTTVTSGLHAFVYVSDRRMEYTFVSAHVPPRFWEQLEIYFICRTYGMSFSSGACANANLGWTGDQRK